MQEYGNHGFDQQIMHELSTLLGVDAVEEPRDADNAFFKAFDEWRHQVARFDDESPEYVLDHGLISFLESQLPSIQHTQDLQNVCSQYFQQDSGYVTFFVKQYQNEIFELLQSQREIKEYAKPSFVYSKLLTNPEITHQMLERAFSNPEETSSKLDNDAEEMSNLIGHPSLLKIVNILNTQDQNGLNADQKAEYQSCLKDLSNIANNCSNVQPDPSTAELTIPETLQEIFHISNLNRKKNKQRKKNNESDKNQGSQENLSVAQIIKH